MPDQTESNISSRKDLQVLDIKEKFSVANTLAYFAEVSVTMKKSFITLSSGVNVISLFPSPMT